MANHNSKEDMYFHNGILFAKPIGFPLCIEVMRAIKRNEQLFFHKYFNF